MRNRSRIEIMNQILEAANGCSSQSQITYKLFLSSALTKEYVMALTDSGLLLYELTSETYKVTEKGTRFLEIYNEIEHMINLSQQPLL
jgi:predicted transcriptional regulator